MKIRNCLGCAFAAALIAGSLVGCGTASDDGQSAESQNQDTATAEFTWSKDMDCTECHVSEGKSMSDSSCLAGTHSAQGVTCVQCHSDEDGLSSAHEGVSASDSMPTKLKSTSVSESTCLSCHGSYDELAAKTTATLVDENGTAVNPHLAPGLTAGHSGNITCVNCHVMHTTSDAQTTATSYCKSCHHAGVFECNTCHA